jgi:hypothetical protein
MMQSNIRSKLPSTICRFLYGKSFVAVIQKELSYSGSLLDIGCGKTSPVKYVNKENRGYTVGLDGYKPYLLSSKRAKVHDDYVLANVNHLCFAEKGFETVALLDVIEHLNKADGDKIINEMQNIASAKVIVFTPNGFLRQDEYDGNVYLGHLSGWSVSEFKNRGFGVVGVNGLKIFRKEKAELKINQFWFSGLVALSEGFAHRFPRVAFQLLATKKINR